MGVAVPPVVQFAVAVAGATVLGIAIATRIFLPQKGIRGIVTEFLREDWKFLGVAWLVTQGVNQLAKYNTGSTYTEWIYRFEGNAVAVFQIWTHPVLTAFFTVVYFVAFPTLVLFTYFAVKNTSPSEARRYVAGYLTLVMLATPFFVFFPVAVATARADVMPLIYDSHSLIVVGTLSTDTLLKAFPSLHTGLAVLAASYASKVGTTYARIAAVVAGLIIISTLYGGIHWLADAAFGAILAVIAYWISQRVEWPFLPD